MTPQPTQAGFNAWVYSVMGIPTAALPTDSLFLTYAYNAAISIANQALRCVAIPGNPNGWSLYVLAVYNLGGDFLIQFAQDTEGAPTFPWIDGEPKLPYFAWQRWRFKLNDFVSGVVQSSSDEGTSVSMVVQKAAENFTLADLQNMKTPWGRQYLALAQRYGPSIWGIN